MFWAPLHLSPTFSNARFNEHSVTTQIGLLSSVKNIKYRLLRIKWEGLSSSRSTTGRLQALGSNTENLLAGRQTPQTVADTTLSHCSPCRFITLSSTLLRTLYAGLHLPYERMKDEKVHRGKPRSANPESSSMRSH